jgi:tetratricopeptide (TPR) repeat protein
MAPVPGRWLALILVLAPPLWANDPRVADVLALQEALRQGRDLLVRGETGRAVELLERQLGKVQGDASYLALLREAYATHLKELQLAGKFETFELYRKRLAILDRPAAGATRPKPEVVRGARPDDDPFQQTPLIAKPDASVTGRAEQAFAARRYAEARELFAKAGAGLSAEQSSQFAYCILHGVVERLNAGGAPAELEREVRAALALAPKDTALEKFGRQVLQQIASRPGNPPAAAVRHGEADGWKLVESASFRVLHKGPADFAEQVARLAEQARADAFARWGQPPTGAWQPACEIALHPTGNDYAAATRQAASAPGHSSIKSTAGRVTARRIDLRADNPELMGCVLPHEVTHVVLGDLFADTPLPRWADEGMAVLAEPRAQVDRYLKTMIRLRQEGKLLHLAQVLRPEYPDAASITVFYVESVSVVEFLVRSKGAPAFAAFARDASGGLDAALARHYGLKNVAELEDRWLRATFTEVDRQMGYGGR